MEKRFIGAEKSRNEHIIKTVKGSGRPSYRLCINIMIARLQQKILIFQLSIEFRKQEQYIRWNHTMKQEESVHEFAQDSIANLPHSERQPMKTYSNRGSKQSFKNSQTNLQVPKVKSVQIKAEICSKTENQIKQVKQCRICLQGVEEGRLIRPCMCSGSITYAHQKCITEWIKRKHESKLIKGKLMCQMCNTIFKYKSARRRSLDISQYCLNYQKQKCSFILFYLLIFTLLLVAIGIIVIISYSNSSTEWGSAIKRTIIKSDNIRIIFICVVFILFIALMFLSILFVIEYGIKSEFVITEVLNYTAPENKKKAKVYPKNNEQPAPSQSA